MLEFMLQLPHSSWASVIGWTLFHSLWQASLIVCILGLGLHLFRVHAAQYRYVWSVAAMFLILGSSIATLEYHRNQACELSTILDSEMNSTPLATDNSFYLISPTSFDLWADWTSLIPWIALLWMLGVMLFSMMNLGGVWYAHRLRHRDTRPVDLAWQEKIRSLAQQMGIRQVPELKTSIHLPSPVVIGWIKPVILIPVSMLTGLNPEQIEAVLAHELAHIYRQDYLVNLFQTAIETLFFFHPAVWYLSKQIRMEREHCCDDIAVQLSGNPLDFAQALTALEQNQILQSSPAMALAGQDRALLHRIQRLIQPEVPQQYRYAKPLFFLLLISSLSGLAWLSPVSASDYPPSQNEAVQSLIHSATLISVDTPPPPPPPPMEEEGWTSYEPVQQMPVFTEAPVLSFPFDKIEIGEGSLEDEMVRLEGMQKKLEYAMKKWELSLKEWLLDYETKTLSLYQQQVDPKTWKKMGIDHWKEKSRKAREIAKEHAFKQSKDDITRSKQVLNQAFDMIKKRQVEMERYQKQQEKRNVEEELHQKEKENLNEELKRKEIELKREIEEKRLQEKKKIKQMASYQIEADRDSIIQRYETLEKLRQLLMVELVRDKIISPRAKRITIKGKKSGMQINGRKLKQDQLLSYTALLKKHGVVPTAEFGLSFSNQKREYQIEQ